MLASLSFDRSSRLETPIRGGFLAEKSLVCQRQERQLSALIVRLRNLVLAPPARAERLHVAFLDAEKRVLGVAGFGVGSERALSLSLRELFAHALSAGAHSMILAHNHPSGDCLPSLRDIEATERIGLIASALEIELLDHLIFTENRLYSMRKRGEL